MRGSIQKKGKSYYVVFRIPDPKTGRKKLKWIAAGKSKKDADIKLNELMGDVHDGTYRELKKATFAEFAELWLNSYAKGKTKPSTFKSYEDIINKHMIPVMGDYYMTELDTGRLQRYVATRLQSVKPKTVINEIVPLKLMFKHAVMWGYLKINFAECVERPRVEKEEMEILMPEEINLFLDKVSPKFKPFFLTAVLTGMRRGELIGLQWGDIDWNHKQIHVRRSFCNTSKKSISPKSKSSVRRIDMSPTLASALKRHKLACPVSENDLVFCTSKGTPFDPDTLIKREYLPALRRAGLRMVRFHDLRHSNVALRIEEGQNIKYIQNQVGHASIQTTLDRYGHLIKEVNQEQAIKLDSALGFVEDSGSLLKPVRSLLEATNKKGLALAANP